MPADMLRNHISDGDTVEPDLIAAEMSEVPSKSSRSQNDSDLTIAIP